ncbi:MAG: transglycosylase SLT domain-containing protein [Desulfarculus sp.]|nr:transglycosylase SLT domain-containing protein [Desulfarculus sp.]
MAPRRCLLALVLLLNLGALTACGAATAANDQPAPAKTAVSGPIGPASAGPGGDYCPPRYLPAFPRDLNLCGEPVPLNDPLVAEALDREFTIAVHDQAQVVMWLKRAQRYFPYIAQRLKEAGLPDDLKYVAVAESSLLTRVVSPAGASGPWQFMDATGRRYGLRKDAYFDDRRNPERATAAALAYLKSLHQEFGSWTLAMAGYNCGEARVRRELAEQGVTSYYDLWLPYETMRYVFRILAAKIILENPGAYGYCLPGEALYQPHPTDTAHLELGRPLHLRTLAAACQTTLKALKEYNPELVTYYLPAGSHQVRVPLGQAKGLSQRLASVIGDQASAPAAPAPVPEVKGESLDKAGRPQVKVPAARPATASQGSNYQVRPGDSLGAIAKRHGVSPAQLRQANGLTGDRIKPGQKLVIPGS